MAVTLEQIKELRDRTGISTTACKKALEEAGGDMDQAIDLLRKKGAAKAASRADRATENGVVAIATGEGKAALLAIGCETDFVAKNEDFLAKVQTLADKLLTEGEGVDLSADEADLNIQMGEKIVIAKKAVVSAANIGTYKHSNNRIGVLIALSSGEQETATDIAMHIAAMNPLIISPDEMSDELVEKEKAIWIEQLKAEGKPENIMDNILAGKEKKFRSEAALIAQPFVKNPEQKISDLLGDASVEAFYRFAV